MSDVNQNLFAALRAAFPPDLDEHAVEDIQGTVHTWRDLDCATAKMANLLAQLQLPEGARIAVQVEKSVEAMMLYLATLRAGYVFLPLNTAYQSAEMEYFLGDAEPSVVVCDEQCRDRIQDITWKSGCRHIFTLNADGSGTLLEHAQSQSATHAVRQKKADDLAAVLYTSGTTGRSKGAALTHSNLLSNAQTLKEYWSWQPGDVLIHALPIFHAHGLFVAVHGALLNGSKMIWLPKFDPKLAVEAMRRATIFMGVPTFYVRMLSEPSLTLGATNNMRLFISGSAPLLMETFDEWKSRTGHAILERYGMSETIMLTSNPCLGERRGGTIGFPLPGVSLRIQAENGHDAPPGEVGTIQVKGPNVFKGYWRMPSRTAEDFTTDGWFITGDVGRTDTDGYITIVGRSKDLIISGGYNVYPAEIESYINAIPEVAESAVVGVPHPDFGEVGIALVIPRCGAQVCAESVIAKLKGELANFKVPKHCLVVNELPRNAMGKVLKKNLREAHAQFFASAAHGKPAPTP